MKKATCFSVMIVTAIIVLSLSSAIATQDDLPYFLQDRGTGISLSMFGTYINKGEFMIYPFYEYYYD